ncbi:hypothetical protein WCE41_07410 [Luteimonas sp. MJ246]|uniref:hypothetical protein n=1 Tax=Luteimonas sp. MJ174 TaxID=3129237 RepID=UPI0031BADBF0
MSAATMDAPMAMPLAGLQEGDLLLMMGDGPLSDLIAWASDGVYSHAAIVVDGGELVEASLAGVRRYPLAARMQEQAHFHYIDAYRLRDRRGCAFTPADLGLVGRHAKDMLGAPYAIDQLALLGVVMAVRGKWPAHPLARRLVRIALDRALPAESPGMVCSEVVYRAWAECAATPRGALAPEIVEGARGTAPFPDIDWKALFDEIGPLLGGQSRVDAASGLRGAAAPAADAWLLADGGVHVPDEALEQARQEVLARLDNRALMRSSGVDAALDARPNPRLVSPQDLANSPRAIRLGRLMSRAEG